MTIREFTAYQIACDHCGMTANNMDAKYSSWDDPDYANEAWLDAEGIAVGGRHACDGPECGRAVLDSHPNLAARSATTGVGRWWVVFDWKWKEYAIFYAEYIITFRQYNICCKGQIWNLRRIYKNSQII